MRSCFCFRFIVGFKGEFDKPAWSDMLASRQPEKILHNESQVDDVCHYVFHINGSALRIA